jgi:hypothetical protein
VCVESTGYSLDNWGGLNLAGVFGAGAHLVDLPPKCKIRPSMYRIQKTYFISDNICTKLVSSLSCLKRLLGLFLSSFHADLSWQWITCKLPGVVIKTRDSIASRVCRRMDQDVEFDELEMFHCNAQGNSLEGRRVGECSVRRRCILRLGALCSSTRVAQPSTYETFLHHLAQARKSNPRYRNR